MREPPPPDLERPYFVTPKGMLQLKTPSTTLPEAALRLLVLIDGKVPLAKLEKHLSGISAAEFARLASVLILEGHIQAPAAVGAKAPAAEDDFGAIDFFAEGHGEEDQGEEPREREFARSLEEAQNIALLLHRQGYYVNIARRPPRKLMPAQGEAYSVLLVEDNSNLASITRKFLTLEGFVPRMAAARTEVITELRKPPVPDVMLLDVVLPDTDGFEILALVRKHAALRRMPVIMLTARATREDVMRGLVLGANGYVTKPFEFEVLIGSIKSVLGLDLEGAAK
jgi:CheY-like chemotaxis protein